MDPEYFHTNLLKYVTSYTTGREDCLNLYTGKTTNNWETSSCFHERPFICQLPVGATLPSAPVISGKSLRCNGVAPWRFPTPRNKDIKGHQISLWWQHREKPQLKSCLFCLYFVFVLLHFKFCFVLRFKVEGKCDDGWRHFEGYCYLIGPSEETQSTASNYCTQNGGNLASILTAAEESFLVGN